MKFSASFLLNSALRLSALGGKFLFIMYAAAVMPAEDFGRVGIVLAISTLITAAMGLEAYQVLLRKIIQGGEQDQTLARGFYIRFAFCGSLLSGCIAAISFFLYGWDTTLVALAAAVVIADHLNTEICRILIGEGRSTLSIMAMSARTGAWAILLPVVTVSGLIPPHWSASLVLTTWLLCSLIGLLCLAPIAKLYLHTAPNAKSYRGLLTDILSSASTWLAVALTWRALETGGRLIVAQADGDAASGRFTLISTIASFALVAIKGILEPIYFPKIVGPDGHSELQKFKRATLLLLPLTICGTFAASLVYNLNARHSPISGNEWIALVVLVVGFSAMCLSQVWHYQLYRAKLDGAILRANLYAAAIGVSIAIVLSQWWSILGTAIGLAIGSIVLLILKARVMHKSSDDSSVGQDPAPPK